MDPKIELQQDAAGAPIAQIDSDLAMDLVAFLTQQHVKISMQFRPEPEGVMFAFPGRDRASVQSLLNNWVAKGQPFRRHRNPSESRYFRG